MKEHIFPMTSQLHESPYNKKNPYSSTMLINRLLTEGSNKETRHFEFSLSGSGLSYEPGDSLGVVPTNCSQIVDKQNEEKKEAPNDLEETVGGIMKIFGKVLECSVDLALLNPSEKCATKNK